VADDAEIASPRDASKETPWPAIGALVLTLGAFSVGGGFLFPASAFRLDQLGYSPTIIGAVGSAGALGYMAGSLLAPLVAGRLGLRVGATLGILVTAALILAFALVPPVLAWYPLRFVHGVANTVLFVCGETAIITVAPAAMRGRIVGLYTAVNSLFFALGPGVIGLFGFASLAPYALVAAAVGLLAVPMTRLGSVTPELAPVPWRRLAIAVGTIPSLLAVVAIWGWLDGSMINLFAVYAIKRGVSVPEAAFLFSLGPIGNTLLQFPIGWLADHLPRRMLLAGLAATGCVMAMLLPLIDFGGTLVVPFLVLFSAVGFGTFTVALVALGDALTGTALVAANAAFGLCWGVGSFAGSAGTGGLMDILGPAGFPLALAAGFLVQSVAVLVLPQQPAASAKMNAQETPP